MSDKLTVSICIPAYNEGHNILHILEGLRNQRTDQVLINEIVVVSSGSTDNTNELVREYSDKHPQFKLMIQKERNGKASAINEFLKYCTDEVIVIESADTIPSVDAIEQLCKSFITDSKLGMTGGAPIPINDPNTFLGYIIHAWWWFHRHIPRFGEIIAYRNILNKISDSTAVDEAFIQARMIQMGYKVVHIDSAAVYNKGPETISDLIKQRRRIFNGHARLFNEEKVKINNMTVSSLKLMLFTFEINSMQQLIWFTCGIALEIYARVLGAYDQYVKKLNPYIWDTAHSTKKLKKSDNQKKKIVFLNFAPIQFMGGAERWMLDVAKSIGNYAETWLVDVHPSIADYYGRVVLGGKYESRINLAEESLPDNHLSIRASTFLPGTKRWRHVRAIIKKADAIYFRYELLEVFLILYFGGYSGLKKSIAGMHTSFVYDEPVGFFNKLHNIVNKSKLSRFTLSRTSKIHVLNEKDVKFFTLFQNKSEIVCIPNYVFNHFYQSQTTAQIDNQLNVLFVGQLTVRKGVDRLIKIIDACEGKYKFHIVGDGALKGDILGLGNSDSVTYHGYLSPSLLNHVYQRADILLLPSRAESFSLVALEAMMHGLPIISSKEINMNLPSGIHAINHTNSVKEYLQHLSRYQNDKQNGDLEKQRVYICNFAASKFEKSKVLNDIRNQLFDI